MIKTKLLFAIVCFLVSGHSFAINENLPFGKKRVQVGVSETDAEIYVNGKLLGKGSTEVTVPKDDCVTVITKKIGYLTDTIEFCN